MPRSAFTSSIRATISRRTSLKKFASTSNSLTAPKRSTNAVCACTPPSTSTCSASPTRPFATVSTPTTAATAAAAAALVAIDNATGELKAMVGGYSFEDSKYNRATQAVRQVGSSFKIYVYADAIENGASPFDTILDAPLTTISGGQLYSPRNYDER